MLNDEQREILPEKWVSWSNVLGESMGNKALRSIVEELANALLALKEARGQLKRVEWIDNGDGNAYCSDCEEWKWHGHAADCELAKNLPEAG